MAQPGPGPGSVDVVQLSNNTADLLTAGSGSGSGSGSTSLLLVGSGGGLLVGGSVVAALQNCTFEGNMASGLGGALLTTTQCAVPGTAAGAGGGDSAAGGSAGAPGGGGGGSGWAGGVWAAPLPDTLGAQAATALSRCWAVWLQGTVWRANVAQVGWCKMRGVEYWSIMYVDHNVDQSKTFGGSFL